ncbi:MAG: hypothetical protein KGI27_08810 [Thaumarchaeota archaeon]|nr:hypothetical protein [Nitrososphaerota archaeon]
MQSSTKRAKEMPELSPEIEEKVRKMESGKATGKKHTPSEYIKHIEQKVPKSSMRSELKKIREENPRLFKALSLDKFG